MNIKNIKHNVSKFSMALAIVGGGMLTSCNDYLDILPMNKVVLEKFWTKKEDATGVLNSCYASLSAKDCLTRLAVWGELRSENVTHNGGADASITEMLKEATKTTNNMANWSSIYTTINFCNTFIHYAPEVAEKDPNYTEVEMKENIAEVTFIRDLCYFHLLRAFKAVPMTFEATIDDTKENVIPATPLNEGLDLLIKDLQAVENQAKVRYANEINQQTKKVVLTDEVRKNTSRVTKWAVYALLADLNLWRGNYDEVIRYCDLVIGNKKQNYATRKAVLSETDNNNLGLFNDIPLLKERRTASSKDGNAYKEIFGDGNSFESIFELGYITGGSNDFVNDFYAKANPNPSYGVPTILYSGIVENGKNDYFTIDDCRVYESINKKDGTSSIGKYTYSNISFDVTQFSKGNAKWPTGTERETKTRCNWIFYRLTDVMLMKAEALILKGDLDEAFNLINAVYSRAHSTSSNNDTKLKRENYQTEKEMMDLLFAERHREFLFEGKRWFDMVRRTIREQDWTFISENACLKQKSNQNAVKGKLLQDDYIFMPYLKNELKVNPLLKQNPRYNSTDEFVQN